MDTFVLNALVQELQPRICPARIQAVGQPDAHTLVFDLWQQGLSVALVMSIAPQHQYLLLTSDPPKDQGLAIGKFLHHHLRGGEIRAIHTPTFERIVTFDIVKRDIDGTPLPFRLILECMGRHGNIILVAGDTEKILESLRHVTAAQSSYRRIAPGAQYVPPPSQEKLDPVTLTHAQFEALVQRYEQETTAQGQASQPFWKYLIQHVQGLSPALAKELAAGPSDLSSRWQAWSRLWHCVTAAAYQPHEIFAATDPEHTVPIGISALALRHADCAAASSMLSAVEHYYRASVAQQEFQALQGSLLSALRVRLSKLQKKWEHLHAQDQHIEQAETYKQQGDLLTANLHCVKKGMREVTVVNYYSADQSPITIVVDPRFTPAQNAQRLFKRYSKLKQGKAMTQQRLENTAQELAYLEEWVYFVESAESLARLHELRRDVAAIFGGGKAAERASSKSPKTQRSQPFLRFTSSDGLEIYVGRSSKENDLLTQRTARPDDLWLHAQGAPGSHVVILLREQHATVPEQTLREAAALAAYHSKFRQAGHVDVMYTPRKYVKKPKGAPPGLVTVSRHQTIRVAPRAAI